MTDPNVTIATPSVAVPAAEAGYVTTEYWVTVVTMTVGLLTLLGIIHVDVNNPLVAQELQIGGGLLAMVVPAVAYSIGRSIRKSGTQG